MSSGTKPPFKGGRSKGGSLFGPGMEARFLDPSLKPKRPEWFKRKVVESKDGEAKDGEAKDGEPKDGKTKGVGPSDSGANRGTSIREGAAEPARMPPSDGGASFGRCPSFPDFIDARLSRSGRRLPHIDEAMCDLVGRKAWSAHLRESATTFRCERPDGAAVPDPVFTVYPVRADARDGFVWDVGSDAPHARSRSVRPSELLYGVQGPGLFQGLDLDSVWRSPRGLGPVLWPGDVPADPSAPMFGGGDSMSRLLRMLRRIEWSGERLLEPPPVCDGQPLTDALFQDRVIQPADILAGAYIDALVDCRRRAEVHLDEALRLTDGAFFDRDRDPADRKGRQLTDFETAMFRTPKGHPCWQGRTWLGARAHHCRIAAIMELLPLVPLTWQRRGKYGDAFGGDGLFGRIRDSLRAGARPDASGEGVDASAFEDGLFGSRLDMPWVKALVIEACPRLQHVTEVEILIAWREARARAYAFVAVALAEWIGGGNLDTADLASASDAGPLDAGKMIADAQAMAAKILAVRSGNVQAMAGIAAKSARFQFLFSAGSESLVWFTGVAEIEAARPHRSPVHLTEGEGVGVAPLRVVAAHGVVPVIPAGIPPSDMFGTMVWTRRTITRPSLPDPVSTKPGPPEPVDVTYWRYVPGLVDCRMGSPEDEFDEHGDGANLFMFAGRFGVPPTPAMAGRILREARIADPVEPQLREACVSSRDGWRVHVEKDRAGRREREAMRVAWRAAAPQDRTGLRFPQEPDPAGAMRAAFRFLRPSIDIGVQVPFVNERIAGTDPWLERDRVLERDSVLERDGANEQTRSSGTRENPNPFSDRDPMTLFGSAPAWGRSPEAGRSGRPWARRRTPEPGCPDHMVVPEPPEAVAARGPEAWRGFVQSDVEGPLIAPPGDPRRTTERYRALLDAHLEARGLTFEQWKQSSEWKRGLRVPRKAGPFGDGSAVIETPEGPVKVPEMTVIPGEPIWAPDPDEAIAADPVIDLEAESKAGPHLIAGYTPRRIVRAGRVYELVEPAWRHPRHARWPDRGRPDDRFDPNGPNYNAKTQMWDMDKGDRFRFTGEPRVDDAPFPRLRPWSQRAKTAPEHGLRPFLPMRSTYEVDAPSVAPLPGATTRAQRRATRDATFLRDAMFAPFRWAQNDIRILRKAYDIRLNRPKRTICNLPSLDELRAEIEAEIKNMPLMGWVRATAWRDDLARMETRDGYLPANHPAFGLSGPDLHEDLAPILQFPTLVGSDGVVRDADMFDISDPQVLQEVMMASGQLDPILPLRGFSAALFDNLVAAGRFPSLPIHPEDVWAGDRFVSDALEVAPRGMLFDVRHLRQALNPDVRARLAGYGDPLVGGVPWPDILRD